MKKKEPDYKSYLSNIFDEDTCANMEQAISRLRLHRDAADAANDLKYSVEIREVMLMVLHHVDGLDEMMIELLWLAGKWEQNQEDIHLNGGMEYVLRFFYYLPDYPGVSRDDIFAMAEIIRGWSGWGNRSRRHFDLNLYKMYDRMGEYQLAAELLDVMREREVVEPLQRGDGCRVCEIGRMMEYYTMLGLLDNAMLEARKLLSMKVNGCFSGPRVGLITLLDALLDHNRQKELAELIPFYVEHLHVPTRAPLRAMLPLIRYKIGQGDLPEAQELVRESTKLTGIRKDKTAADRFRALQEELRLSKPVHPCPQ